MKRLAKRRLSDVSELDITAFMNLMVILVPFLLMTAVFSRLTILELNLPALDAKIKKEQKIKLQLEIVLRENSFDIQEAKLGMIKSFPRTGDETRWDLFDTLLVELKRRYPKEDNITLLLEPGIDYKTLIKVMDHVRSVDEVNVLDLQTYELFPNISIGDAPVLVDEKGKGK